jgi:hydroxymethylbilane synthase
MASRPRTIRIGSRGSALALAQSRWVKERLEARYPERRCEIVVIKTAGDRMREIPAAEISRKGLFVKEIEEALLRGEIDLAVHSMKDMPAESVPGLTCAAIPQREDPRDALVCAAASRLAELPAGATIATGSPRRRAQILHARRDLRVVPIRGNVDTRLGKLDRGLFSGLVLALAGLRRLGREHRVSEVLDDEVCVSAVGQGALCVQARAGGALEAELAFLHHAESAAEVSAERAFLARLGGGCRVPIAARARVEGSRCRLLGLVSDPDGEQFFRGEISGEACRGEELGAELAARLLDQGAARLLERWTKALAR